jgi:DNA-binding NarL/FixJ family response regulator
MVSQWKPTGRNDRSATSDFLLQILSLATVGKLPLEHENWWDEQKASRGFMGKIRVLLADNHDTILAQVCRVLGEEFEIVGTVNNGLQAVAAVKRLDPDVLVIDISMPVLDGLEAASRLRFSHRTKIVFLTVHEDEDFVAAAFSVGGLGYVTKADVTTDLIPAIREALDGRIYISKSIPR